MKQLGRLYMEEQNRHNNGDIAWKKNGDEQITSYQIQLTCELAA